MYYLNYRFSQQLIVNKYRKKFKCLPCGTCFYAPIQDVCCLVPCYRWSVSRLRTKQFPIAFCTCAATARSGWWWAAAKLRQHHMRRRGKAEVKTWTSSASWIWPDVRVSWSNMHRCVVYPIEYAHGCVVFVLLETISHGPLLITWFNLIRMDR